MGTHPEHGSIVYRLPPQCAAGVLPERFGPPAPAAKPPAAKAEAPKVTKPQAKKATQKRVRGCKPGRVRDSRGICRRKR